MAGPTTEPASFDEYLAERNLRAAKLISTLCIVLVPSGVVLDYFTHRTELGWLFGLRLGVSAISGVCAWLTRLPGARRFAFALGVAPILATAIAIEVMVEGLEGYSSPYYAGLTHCLLALGVIFYWRVREIVIACSLVLAVWVVPTLWRPELLETGPFANNLYALVVSAAVAIASNGSRFAAVAGEHAARAQLETALDRLKELDHAKNQFFANVSHELRTPLTLILAPIDELLETTHDPKSRDMLEVVRRNASRLLRHIDELLELSRLDAGRLRLNVTDVDLKELLVAQIENSHVAASAAGLTLELDAPDTIFGISGDAHRVDIVITNLVSNALKYTPSGGKIVLRLRDEGDTASVIVADTGQGISESDLGHVFERFYQVTGGDRRRQGAGIGLALAKELADLHNGSLTVTSQLDAGSTFTFRLKKGREHFNPDVVERRTHAGSLVSHERRFEDAGPSAPPRFDSSIPPPSLESVHFSGGRRPRVVVAEDNRDLRLLIHKLLSKNCDVFEAEDGEAALLLAKQTLPDLIVSDVMMPRMDGTELCRALKADPGLRSIPVILLTARVGSEATMNAYAHGADDFVSKPFHPRVLVARVTAQLKLRALSLQLVSQEKAVGINTLAAGVAHEVRNPLNAITGACQILLSGKGDSDRKERLLRVALDAADRVERIVAALDAHARPAEADHARPYDVREGIDATIRLLEHRLGPVKLHREYDTEKLALVRAAAINQVVLNLLDNAGKAGAKNVWVSVRDDDDRIRVAVTDDGGGIAPDIAHRVFDPFFTTREPGQGTGLGLHLSYRIVSDHGGRLWHEAREGGGARFVFEVPMASVADARRGLLVS
jgi:signal transduction histidine kinase